VEQFSTGFSHISQFIPFQKVKINDFFSEWINIPLGLPQGSVLGLILGAIVFMLMAP
jgi:hypothetical protein